MKTYLKKDPVGSVMTFGFYVTSSILGFAGDGTGGRRGVTSSTSTF